MPDEAEQPGINPEQTLQNKNLAEDLDEEELLEIGSDCLKGYELDLESRYDWENDLDDWMALAKQLREPKSYPWQGASNVKYPLLSTAAMQFAARAYPSLVPSNGKLVKSQVIGKDADGKKYEKADRVSTFLSYQILHDMDRWEEDMDKMLMMLPVVGTIFKKTCYDPAEDKICSKVILPKNLVVNYWAKCLDSVERISEVIEMSPRVLKERQNQEIFLDIDLGVQPAPEDADMSGYTSDDETVPYTLVEQHTFIDLDDDGYAEPYIVTFERFSGKILRIAARYDLNDVQLKDDEKTIKKIKPIQVYTKFGFVPNPDGSFYDIGFGVLLGPLNESVNTIINQLIDSGSMKNLQAGFIGKSLRMKMGDTKFAPGEWKPVNAMGDDLRKQIVPLPAGEPSTVLLQLMGTLVTSGKELASVAEIFVGKMPGQNTPATTTMASIEQGMKVFTAVYKRIFRSLAEEFKKIFDLNKKYLDPNTYVKVLDEAVGPDDFDDSSYDICPGADPTAVSQTEKLLKAQGLLELMPMVPGILDPIKVYSRVLEAQEQPSWQELFSAQVQQSGQLPPPPPDPKLMAIQAKMEADQRRDQIDTQSKQMDMELQSRSAEQQMAMKAQEHAQDMQMEQDRSMNKSASEIAKANIYAAIERARGQQTLQNNQAVHEQKMQQTKEVQQSKQQTSSNGNSKQRPSGSSKPSKKQ